MVKHKNKVAFVLLFAMLITGVMGILAPLKTYAVNAGGQDGGETNTSTGTSY